MVLRIIAFIVFACLTLSFNNDGIQFITNNGIGQAKLDESNYESIRLMFPGGKTKRFKIRFKTNAYLRTPNDCIHIKGKPGKKFVRKTNYTLSKKKIAFKFNSKKILFSITVWGDRKYKTEKGIIVGKSTFRDLDSLYGKTNFEYYSIKKHQLRLIKKHGNMTFYSKISRVFDKLDYTKVDDDKLNDLVIEEIKISTISLSK